MAVGSVRPDPKDRQVTAEMCRELTGLATLSDSEAQEILEHMYSVAGVLVDAFNERSVRLSDNEGRLAAAVEDDRLTRLTVV